ncbi:unnamed protein product, partial [Coregonus sp. 'balchen']
MSKPSFMKLEDVWTFLIDIFSGMVNKHAPIKKMRIINRFSPWFYCYLAELLHPKNTIWQKAQHTNTQADWLSFRQMRNKCTQANRKAKVSFFKEQLSLCGSNPKKFWKTLHMSFNVDDVIVTDKERMAELCNHHFI